MRMQPEDTASSSLGHRPDVGPSGAMGHPPASHAARGLVGAMGHRGAAGDTRPLSVHTTVARRGEPAALAPLGPHYAMLGPRYGIDREEGRALMRCRSPFVRLGIRGEGTRHRTGVCADAL